MAGTHFTEKWGQVRGRCVWSEWLSVTPWRPLHSPIPALVLGMERFLFPAIPGGLSTIICRLGMGTGCPPSQLECLRQALGNFPD
jgi:hypothetical protein